MLTVPEIEALNKDVTVQPSSETGQKGVESQRNGPSFYVI